MSDDLVKQLLNAPADPLDIENLCIEAADRIEELEKQNASLEAAIKRQAGAARTLREYTLAEVRHLSDMDRSEYFAAQTVDSERDANAMLTERIKELEKACNEWAEVSQSNYQRAKAAEAKLAVVVEALEFIALNFNKPDRGLTDFGERQHYLFVACRLRDKARTTLAEIKGEQP